MTKKDFFNGIPFKIQGNEEVYKYDEKEGGELYQLIHDQWLYAVYVISIQMNAFEAAAIKRDGIIKRNHLIRYDELDGFLIML